MVIDAVTDDVAAEETVMKTFNSIAGRPDPEFCFGRDELCDAIVRGALDQGSVLLFGGRQSGKTTVLQRIGLLHATDENIVPVFVDLMKMSNEASGAAVFELLLEKCAETLGLSHSAIAGLVDVDRFASELLAQLTAVDRAAARVVFLIDEAKRLTSAEARKGIQDNLFALIYGNTVVSGRCALVFAGAQDLYTFCTDLTSPIGSRAAFFSLHNLDHDTVAAIVSAIRGHTAAVQLVDLIQRLAGGQAGLTVRLALRSDGMESVEYGDLLIAQKSLNSGLLRTWANSLTDEARAIQDQLLENGEVLIKDIPGLLQQHTLDRFAADRAIDEIAFTGIAVLRGGSLVLVNELYGAYACDYVLPLTPTDAETSVWAVVEETEIALRKIVRAKYEAKWAGSAEPHFQQAIGDETWSRVLENKCRGERAYKYSKPQFDDPFLDFAYLGQLSQMMVNREAWDLFKHLFRDKRQLEDIVADVTPVRNDHAHFRRVPPRELVRCRLRCEDLLFLLEQDA